MRPRPVSVMASPGCVCLSLASLVLRGQRHFVCSGSGGGVSAACLRSSSYPVAGSIVAVRAASPLARHTRLRPSLTPLSWSSCVLPLMVVRWRLLVEGMSCVAMDGRIWLTEGFLQLLVMSCVVMDDGVCARVGMSARVRR